MEYNNYCLQYIKKYGVAMLDEKPLVNTRFVGKDKWICLRLAKVGNWRSIFVPHICHLLCLTLILACDIVFPLSKPAGGP